MEVAKTAMKNQKKRLIFIHHWFKKFVLTNVNNSVQKCDEITKNLRSEGRKLDRQIYGKYHQISHILSEIIVF